MVSLMLAIVSSMLITVLMRLSEGRRQNPTVMLVVNYFVCCLCSWLTAGAQHPFPTAEKLPLVLLLGTISGVLYLGGFVFLQWNLPRNGVVLSATFQKLGVVVPTVMAILFFGETPRILQVLGILLTLAAIILMQEKQDQSAGSLPGLIVLLLCGGLADTIVPYDEKDGSGNGFNFVNYNAHDMMNVLEYALSLYENHTEWAELVKNVMKVDFSWSVSAKKYIDIYDSLM